MGAQRHRGSIEKRVVRASRGLGRRRRGRAPGPLRAEEKVREARLDDNRTHTHTHTHTQLRVHNQKKGVSENEAPGPVGAYTTTHNNTPTQMPDRESKLLTATFDQECSFCREESGL